MRGLAEHAPSISTSLSLSGARERTQIRNLTPCACVRQSLLGVAAHKNDVMPCMGMCWKACIIARGGGEPLDDGLIMCLATCAVQACKKSITNTLGQEQPNEVLLVLDGTTGEEGHVAAFSYAVPASRLACN